MKIKNLLASLITFCAVLVWPVTGLAHVHMDKSSPVKGAVLNAAPTKVDVWFSGKVEAEWSKIEVTDQSGKRVDNDAVVKGESAKQLSVGLGPLSTGEYNVKLNVIAGDGHRIKGGFSFSVK